jgi:hypothetical protein
MRQRQSPTRYGVGATVLLGCAGLTTTACRVAPTGAGAPATAPSVAPKSGIDRTSIERACGGLVRESEALAAATDRNRRGAAFVGLGGKCYPTAKGAWAPVVTPASAEGAQDESIAIVHVGSDGRISKPEVIATAFDSPYGIQDFIFKIVSDYDGDGDEEIWVHAHGSGNEGSETTLDRLYTAKSGAPERLSTAARIPFVDVADIDHDGKLDLLVSPFHGETSNPCSGFTTDHVDGPTLAYHALLDGTFSADDAAATTFAKAACPAAPRSPRTALEVACARLWGVPTKTIVASLDHIEEDCRKGRLPRTGEEPCSDVDACDQFQAERQIATTVPPVSLR